MRKTDGFVRSSLERLIYDGFWAKRDKKNKAPIRRDRKEHKVVGSAPKPEALAKRLGFNFILLLR